MNKPIDSFFERVYHPKNYDCLHFTKEVWAYLTGEDLGARFEGLLGTASDRSIERRHRRAFVPLERPVTPCLAFMSRPRFDPHVGVYLDRLILHIRPDRVELQPPEIAAPFCKVKYYLPCKE